MPPALPTLASPRQIARLVEVVARGVRSRRGLGEALGVDASLVQQAVSAASWLGFVDGDGDPQLTALGLEYAYAGRSRPKVWARAVWDHPFFADWLVDRSGLPNLEDAAEAVTRAESGLDADGIAQRASAVVALVAPAMSRRPAPVAENQLALPLPPRSPLPTPPRLAYTAGREYNPDIYRYLLAVLLDVGELGLGQMRALLDRAAVSEAPIGGYLDLATARGDVVRMEERIVASVGAIQRRVVAESTPAIILSDAGWRAWLADCRAASGGDRQAEIRRDRNKGRYRIWDRRLFGRDLDYKRVDAELATVLPDRSIDAFPRAQGPGQVPAPVKSAFLDAWERPDLAIVLPPGLLALLGGLGGVNQQLKTSRQSSHDVLEPGLADRPVLYHGGLLHPGEPLPKAIPDQRTLRLRLVMHAPYPAMVAAALLLHRGSATWEVAIRRGTPRFLRDGDDLGELLDVLDGFAASRGWLVCRRRRGGLSSTALLEILEACGLVVQVGARRVLAERFFVQLRSDAEEIEVYRRLQPLSEALEAHVAALPVETAE
jgi:hypothetical protein